MPKKKLYNSNGIVYSTDPGFELSREDESRPSLPAAEQRLTIVLDRKHRGGKVVSLISGFEMTETEIENIARQLKSVCGSGGSAKDGEVIIQGDHREKILQWLLKNGYKKTKKM